RLAQAGLAVRRRIQRVAFRFQPVGKRHAQVFFVFHQQNALGHCEKPGSAPAGLSVALCLSFSLLSLATGRWMIKELPLPNSLFAVSLPPMDSMMVRASGRPSPVP